MCKLKDAIYGFAVGDAMGVPFEFQNRDTFQCVDMIGYGTHNQPKGTWSDDTSMTLATCDSIKNKEKIDCADIRKNFEKWLFDAKYTPFNEVFDCGMTCESAIRTRKGLTDEFSNGNGSLMRILPLSFVDNISDQEIKDVSAITHAHPISMEGCVIYVRIAMDLLHGYNIKDTIKKNVDFNSIYKPLLEVDILQRKNIKSSGYIVDSMIAALWTVNDTNSYEECILNAVNLGGDTDTIAAIAGGLAGIIYGFNNIPKTWIDNLKGKDIIDRCLF